MSVLVSGCVLFERAWHALRSVAGASLAIAGAPVVGNSAQGFHHARLHMGNDFCTFNSLALIVEAYPERTIGVLDVDEHEGDGTSVFATGLPNLSNATLFGTQMGGPRHPRIRAVDFSLRPPSPSSGSGRLPTDIQVGPGRVYS